MIASIMLVFAGAWMLTMSDHFIYHNLYIIHRNPAFVHFFGFASMVFFFMTFIAIVAKLTDKKPGLVFNSNGVVDNSSYMSSGFIPWSDIIDVQKVTTYKTQVIKVLVKNPSFYVERQRGIKKYLAKFSFRTYKTPVFINPNTLEIDCADDVLDMLRRYKERYSAENTKAKL
ncbi:hypothetical protein OW565_07240 [Acidithiobacillus ferriphilus]|nr:hypothetical protein [Acidithiobacillus ferriphilus]